MTKGKFLILLSVIFGAIAYLFWYNELIYSLPTPVPKNYQAVYPGNVVHISQQLNQKNHQPLFLHFFNPDCPCSKFNIAHFKSLVKEYGDKANFAIVVISDKTYSAAQIQNKFDLNIPVLFDKSVAIACGVYSTPQAVIINSDQKLFYRGNYNRSRYCADKKSNYAQQALENLLNANYTTISNPYALTSYGCQLPTCSR